MKKILLSFILITIIQAQHIEIKHIQTFGIFKDAVGFTIINETPVVLDRNECQIFSFTSEGKTNKNIGGFGWKSAQFDDPNDIDADLLKIYIADKNNNRIQIFDKDLNFLSSLNSETVPNFELEYPSACRISNAGDLYILDSENKVVFKLLAGTTEFTEIININNSDFPFENPGYFDLDQNSNIYFIHKNQLYIYDPYGNGIKSIKLDFSPVNIRISNNIILLNTENTVYYSKLKNELIFKPILHSENIIVQSELTDSKLFVLHSNSVKVYKIEK